MKVLKTDPFSALLTPGRVFFSLMSEFVGEKLCLTFVVAANYRELCFWSWESFFLSAFFWLWVFSLYKQVPCFPQRNKFRPQPFFCLPAEKFLSLLACLAFCGARPLLRVCLTYDEMIRVTSSLFYHCTIFSQSIKYELQINEDTRLCTPQYLLPDRQIWTE